MRPFVKALRRPVRLLNATLLVTLMVCCVAYIAPSFFGFGRYIITGGSMSGTFEKGSIVFAQEVPVEDLAVGDVITYLPPPDSGLSSLVTHRIISIEPGENGVPIYRTQGDANPAPDPWQFHLLADTQPVSRFDVPYLGHAFIFLAEPRNRMIVIGIPAGGIALMALRDLVRALRRKDDHQDGDDDNPAEDTDRQCDPDGTPRRALHVVRSRPAA